MLNFSIVQETCQIKQAMRKIEKGDIVIHAILCYAVDAVVDSNGQNAHAECAIKTIMYMVGSFMFLVSLH